MSKATFDVKEDNLQVVISKVFNAPIKRVWQAHTQPDQIAQWWRNTKIETFDFKVGGKWRFIDHGKSGNEEHAFRGEFLEIDEPNKIVRTFEYEPWAGHVMTETLLLETVSDSQTKQTTTSKFQNLADLEGMVNSGMEKGATAGLERLAQLVESV